MRISHDLTQNVWARPVQALTGASGPSATTINYQGRLADGNAIWRPEAHQRVELFECRIERKFIEAQATCGSTRFQRVFLRMGQVEVLLAFPALRGRDRFRRREDVRGLRGAFCLGRQGGVFVKAPLSSIIRPDDPNTQPQPTRRTAL